jgi:transposase
MVHAFEGNKANNRTMLPVITAFTADCQLPDVTVVADAGKSFRMAKSDLQARPIYHHKRDPIEAHLTIVFAALAVSRWIEARTGWSIRNVRPHRPP